MPDLELKSPDGSVLGFTVIRRSPGETEFEVTVKTDVFSGTASSTTYVNGSPAELFRWMADNWRGWRGEKKWEDLEGRVSLSATHDTLGHINLAVELAGADYYSRLRTIVQYEAGQLEKLAAEISEVLPT